MSEYDIVGPWRKMTRFLRGRPSSTPDTRTREDLAAEAEDEVTAVEELDGTDAIHVRTVAGICLLSITKERALSFSVDDLVVLVREKLHKSNREVLLLHEGSPLHSGGSMQL